MSLTIFCGKGGVGKTTLSLSLGLWGANRGRKTVVVTSHPLGELAVAISLQGLKDKYPCAASNLFVIHIDPREELANKVKQQVPSPLLARAVLGSRIYQSLIEVAPGLKELAFLARLQRLAEKHPDSGTVGDFELLIWDAPATGHFIQTLKVSQNFDTYLSGPFAAAGREMRHFFSDPEKVRVYAVTVLEEMAVEETIELCGSIATELTLPPRGVICNLASPLLSTPDAQFEELRSRLGADKAEDLRFVLDRQVIERGLYGHLRASVALPLHIVERKPHWDSDLELLMGLSGRVAEVLGD